MLCCASAQAKEWPLDNALEALARSADLIVIGVGHKSDDPKLTGTLAVERVIKGKAARTITLDAREEEDSCGVGDVSLEDGERVLLFIVGREGHFQIMPMGRLTLDGQSHGHRARLDYDVAQTALVQRMCVTNNLCELEPLLKALEPFARASKNLALFIAPGVEASLVALKSVRCERETSPGIFTGCAVARGAAGLRLPTAPVNAVVCSGGVQSAICIAVTEEAVRAQQARHSLAR